MIADNVPGVPGPMLDAMRNGDPIADEHLRAIDEFRQVKFNIDHLNPLPR